MGLSVFVSLWVITDHSLMLYFVYVAGPALCLAMFLVLFSVFGDAYPALLDRLREIDDEVVTRAVISAVPVFWWNACPLWLLSFRGFRHFLQFYLKVRWLLRLLALPFLIFAIALLIIAFVAK